MSYIVGEEAVIRTMGVSSAELNPDIVKQFGLEDGLQRFGKQLLEQFPEAAGIEMVAIEVVFMMKRKDTSR